jgi:hypothetical protein
VTYAEFWFRWLLSCAGIIYLVTESSIFAPIRMSLAMWSGFIRSLIYCRACTGFWVGVIGGAVNYPIALHNPWASATMAGLTGMMLGYVWTCFVPNHAWKPEQEILRTLGAFKVGGPLAEDEPDDDDRYEDPEIPKEPDRDAPNDDAGADDARDRPGHTEPDSRQLDLLPARDD